MASVCLSSRATAGSVTAQRVATRRGSTVRAMRCSAASTSAASAKVDAMSAEQLKRQILRLGALTDRGQLLFPQKAYAPLDLYNAGHKEEIVEAVEALAKTKDYFASQFSALRKPKTNVQMVQQVSTCSMHILDFLYQYQIY